MDGVIRELQAIKDILGQMYITLEGIAADIPSKGNRSKKAGRAELLLRPEELGLDEETPTEWKEKLRLIPRVLAKLNFSIQPGCWIYSGVMTQGQMLIYHPMTSKKVTLRRFLYEYLIGPLPEDFRVSKPKCHDLCVHPNHLIIPRTMVQSGALSHREDDQAFLQYVQGMEKNRRNTIFERGQKYLAFPTAHWDIVYRAEQGQLIGEHRFRTYREMHKMYHYLDPIVQTPQRDPSIPTDVEWMNEKIGPAKATSESSRSRTLADIIDLEDIK